MNLITWIFAEIILKNPFGKVDYIDLLQPVNFDHFSGSKKEFM